MIRDKNAIHVPYACLKSCVWNEVMQFSYPTGKSLSLLKICRLDEVIIHSLKAPDRSLSVTPSGVLMDKDDD